MNGIRCRTRWHRFVNHDHVCSRCRTERHGSDRWSLRLGSESLQGLRVCPVKSRGMFQYPYEGAHPGSHAHDHQCGSMVGPYPGQCLFEEAVEFRPFDPLFAVEGSCDAPVEQSGFDKEGGDFAYCAGVADDAVEVFHAVQRRGVDLS